MKKICFSCPTVLLKRPIMGILSHLEGFELGILFPIDIIKGYSKIHFTQLKKVKIKSYSIIESSKISSEWPIPINPLFIIDLIKLLKTYDIIHIWVPFYIVNTLLVILKRILYPNKKLFLTMDTFPGISFKMNTLMDLMFKVYYKSLGKFVFNNVEKVIIYNKSMRQYAIESGIQNKKIKIIPTGVNVNLLEKDKSIREEFKINPNDKIILFVGILVPRKGIDILIKVANKLKREFVKFILVGDGPTGDYYKKLVVEYNLEEKLIFTGFRNDMHNFYQEADIFLFPSRGEGLAGVLLESMTYGVPIITSDIPGTRDLIRNNYNGFLCDVENVDCYKEKVKILIENKLLREKFIKNSKEIIKNKFNWEKNIKLFKELYK